MHINQSTNKNKIGTAIVIATVLLACCLSVGVASAASDSNFLDNMPVPSGAPGFDGNFTFPSGMNPFNGTGGPGGQGGFPGNGTFPGGMNGNFTRPDASGGGPGDAQPFNNQSQTTNQTDYTLLIVGIAIAAVIIVVVVVVVLKKRKNNHEAPAAFDQAAPPTTEASASL